MPSTDIVKSTTIIEAASPTAPGYGIPIIGVTLTAPQDALWGSSLVKQTAQDTWQDDLTALGFVDGDPLWEELAKGFQADVVPEYVLMGKRSAGVAQVTNFLIDGGAGAATDGNYTITINGED